MTLGERILAMRTRLGISQSALAEKLDVSRQSVSKWETDASVPELDKLVAMCELFGVSMDELVRGVRPTEGAQIPEEPPAKAPERKGLAARQIVGIALLCTWAVLFIILTLLGGPLMGLIYASPFIACGLICLLVRRHTALCCVWALWLIVYRYLLYATGIRLRWIFYPFLYREDMFIHAVIAWAEVIPLALLIIFTARLALRRYRESKSK